MDHEREWLNLLERVAVSTQKIAEIMEASQPAAPAPEPHDPGHPHLIGGKFQSDKYPSTPRGKVPLSCKDTTAQDLLWEYAQRRRKVDAEFAADLEIALANAGYTKEKCSECGGIGFVCDNNVDFESWHIKGKHGCNRESCTDNRRACEKCGDKAKIAELEAQLTTVKEKWRAVSDENLELRAAIGESLQLGKPCPETCCSPSFVRRNPEGEIMRWTITVNEYQRANLLWLLCDVAGYDRPEAIVQHLQTGDWTGEIANALRLNEQGKMEESKVRPNRSPDELRRWLAMDREPKPGA